MSNRTVCTSCEKNFDIMVLTQANNWKCFTCYGILDKAFVLIEDTQTAIIIQGTNVDTVPSLDRKDFMFERDYLDSQTEVLRDLAAEYGYRESEDFLHQTSDGEVFSWRGSVIY